MSTKRILLFSQDGVGGAEKITSMIGNQLHKEGYEVLFCLINCKSQKSISEFINKGIQILRIASTSVPRLVLRIFSVIKHTKPDVIFSSVININNKVLLFKGFFPNTKFIIRCDTNLRGYNKKQLFYIRATYKKADLIIAQTAEMKDELTQVMSIPPNKIKVLSNPIDKDRIQSCISNTPSPFENNKKHIVAVGRFRRVKGFDLLIEAFILLYKKRKDVDLYIVGDDTNDKEGVVKQLRDRISEESIDGIVHFTGFQTNPYSYMKYADCYALSSRWEGLPNVVIESLFLGTPVVAFNCIPVIERIIDDGVNGLIVPNGNIAELSDALNRAIDFGEVKSTYLPSEITDFTVLF